jgi:hypothetical protein
MLRFIAVPKNQTRLVGVGGARRPPYTIAIMNKVAVYAPAEWEDTLTLFHLYQYMNTLWFAPYP